MVKHLNAGSSVFISSYSSRNLGFISRFISFQRAGITGRERLMFLFLFSTSTWPLFTLHRLQQSQTWCMAKTFRRFLKKKTGLHWSLLVQGRASTNSRWSLSSYSLMAVVGNQRPEKRSLSMFASKKESICLWMYTLRAQIALPICIIPNLT